MEKETLSFHIVTQKKNMSHEIFLGLHKASRNLGTVVAEHFLQLYKEKYIQKSSGRTGNRFMGLQRRTEEVTSDKN